LRYFHLTDEEYCLFEALDGSASLAELQKKFELRFAPRRLSLQMLESFLGLLHEDGLVIADSPGQGGELARRARAQGWQKLRAGLSNVLAIRFRGIDPQRFLDALLPWCRWFFSRWAMAMGLLLVSAAAALVATHLERVQSRLPEVQALASPGNLALLAVAVAITKVLHELGHALACRRFGAECHEMGLMLLVLTPCLYCNVSDAWMIPSKWRRAAIGAAGVGVELVLAALCTFLWWFSEPGLFNALCFNIMLVCSVGTLVFNANPLMRYDGYFVLSDIAEIPNLAQAAANAARGWIAQWMLGIPARQDDARTPAQRVLLPIYAVLSTAYRGAVIIGILWFLHRVLKPHRLEVLVPVLAALVAAGIVVVPLWQAVRFVQQAYWSGRMKKRRALASSVALASCLAAAALFPFPHRISAPALLEAQGARRIYVEVAGTLVDRAELGSAVREGRIVAVLDNADLKLEVVRLRGERGRQKLHVENLKNRQAIDSQAAAQIPTAEQALADLDERLERRLADEQRLVVVAPVSGTLLPGRRKPRPNDSGDLETWWGQPLDEINRGCWLETGSLLCQIGDAATLEAVLLLDQGDVEFVEAGQKVRVQLDQLPGQPLSGTVREVAKVDLKVTPPEFLPEGVIPTRADASGIERPVNTVYQARVEISAVEQPLLIGQAGVAKIDAGRLSLARRLARYLSQVFRFEAP